MRILLDTVTFHWVTSSPAQLSRAAMSALRNESAVREMSAISLSEIAIKSARGKLTFGQDDIKSGIAALRLRVLPQSPTIARKHPSLAARTSPTPTTTFAPIAPRVTSVRLIIRS